jgi:hypothetical protein
MSIEDIADGLSELESALRVAVTTEKARLIQKSAMLQIMKLSATAETAVERANQTLTRQALANTLNRFFPSSYGIE